MAAIVPDLFKILHAFDYVEVLLKSQIKCGFV
jgi:hypothetical protein